MTLIGQAPARWTAPDGAWTEPDLHFFPQDGHRYEIVDGSLYAAPPPGGETMGRVHVGEGSVTWLVG